MPAPPPPPPIPGRGRVIRVTDERDGDIRPRMYSYWANAFIQDDVAAIVFCSGPRFFRVSLISGNVERLGPLVNYTGETEGWYWSPTGKLYIPNGAQLHRVDPFNPADDEVVLDISATHPGCDLWQAHSSDDGRVHSATVRRIVSDGPYQKFATVAVRNGVTHVIHAVKDLDESQVDRSGEFVLIKEGDDNRIVNLVSGQDVVLADADGALGHSDCGAGVVVGEDNIRGACMWMNLRDVNDRRPLFSTWNMGYVSLRAGVCLHSGDAMLDLVALDGSGLTPVLAHGNRGTDYDDRVKANLDPTGRVACYMSNVYGRRDVFLVVL